MLMVLGWWMVRVPDFGEYDSGSMSRPAADQ